MCGILGIYKRGGAADKDRAASGLIRMQDMLAHRGPDDRGIYHSPDGRCSLAHTRLSIIDLTAAGHQPMSNKSGTVWVSFNGEIYNFRHLQKELADKGHVFRSNSDTEVIVAGYEAWGIGGLLCRLRGMFAFAIYDSKAGRLLLARDRLGIKPLYYYQGGGHDGETLVFASEVRAIKESGFIGVERNEMADMAFLLLGSVPEPMTTIKGVSSLPAGSYLIMKEADFRIIKYYNLADCFEPERKDEVNQSLAKGESKGKSLASGEAMGEIPLNLLSETVDLHLISDAPLGIFLSGGIDSSALVALSTKRGGRATVTLSIAFDEVQYSEARYQRLIAKKYGTDHREVRVTEDDFYGELENIFSAMDQPTVDGINTYFVSKAAKETGLKTVLSGMGGDEVFCGYDHFKRAGLLMQVHGLPRQMRLPFALSSAIGGLYGIDGKWRRLGYLRGEGPLRPYMVVRGFFTPREAARFLNASEKEAEGVIDALSEGVLDSFDGLRPSSLSPVDWLSYMELSLYLRNQLLKDVDFMSMYHSVETRVPFLDHLLVERAASISSKYKMAADMPKPLLVKPLKGMLPDEIIYRRKQGFTFPFDPWIKKKGRGLLEEALSGGGIDRKSAGALWNSFEKGDIHWSRAWGIVVAGRKV